ncbi:Protein of uncharacterised function (DUF2580) [Nocardia cyriacigeorgica]|jgi:hypothetical protein|uniref:Protein of uncharacterized function (DUF2580) n=2 Tax=Nocardia cyriacigeorgica TaxID=135487 RepID=A0A4U8W636_9NOCA|nr:Protein of uncharacterised function (DUF2580) [Nocardia cyriacigeorgica]
MGEALMKRISADTEGIAAYGATAGVMAGELAAAGAGAAGAGPALLGPIFGLIGGDFMAAYAATHAGHVAAISQLSAVVSSMSTAAVGAAANYAGTDTDIADSLRTTSAEG